MFSRRSEREDEIYFRRRSFKIDFESKIDGQTQSSGGRILTQVREYRLIVRVVEYVVPVAQREFFQVRNLGFVDDKLEKKK